MYKEAVTKTIPKKKKCKKAKWLSEETLQITEKRCKRQGRKSKTYPTECRVQRKARRETKAFLNEKCKEIEKNNRMEKIRNLFKKIRATRGTFH